MCARARVKLSAHNYKSADGVDLNCCCLVQPKYNFKTVKLFHFNERYSKNNERHATTAHL